MIRRKGVTLLLSFLCCVSWSQSEKEGVSVQTLTNSKDIYHPRNDEVRNRMIQQAVLDAIEKGSTQFVYSEVLKITESETNKYGSEFNEVYLDQVLAQYNVTWQRINTPIFKSVGAKKWECRVRGIVSDLKDMPKADLEEVKRRNKVGSFKEPTVKRKKFNRILIDTDGSSEYYVIYRDKKKEYMSGSETKEVVKGYAKITRASDSSVEAKLLKGIYSTQKGDKVRPGYFKIKEQGFFFEHGIARGGSNRYFADEDVLYSFGYRMYNHNHHTTLSIGWTIQPASYEALDDNYNKQVYNTSLNSFYAEYSIGINIIPQLVSINPLASFGIVKENYPLWSNTSKINGDLSRQSKGINYGVGCRVEVNIPRVKPYFYVKTNDYNRYKDLGGVFYGFGIRTHVW